MSGETWFGLAALLTAIGSLVGAVAAAVVLLRRVKVIHDLVNSDMTAALQAGLDANRGQLAGLKELVAFKQAQGVEVDQSTLALLVALDARVNDLEGALAGRVRKQAAAIMDDATKGRT
jgi:hypothetical protein